MKFLGDLYCFLLRSQVLQIHSPFLPQELHLSKTHSFQITVINTFWLLMADNNLFPYFFLLGKNNIFLIQVLSENKCVKHELFLTRLSLASSSMHTPQYCKALPLSTTQPLNIIHHHELYMLWNPMHLTLLFLWNSSVYISCSSPWPHEFILENLYQIFLCTTVLFSIAKVVENNLNTHWEDLLYKL